MIPVWPAQSIFLKIFTPWPHVQTRHTVDRLDNNWNIGAGLVLLSMRD